MGIEASSPVSAALAAVPKTHAGNASDGRANADAFRATLAKLDNPDRAAEHRATPAQTDAHTAADEAGGGADSDDAVARARKKLGGPKAASAPADAADLAGLVAQPPVAQPAEAALAGGGAAPSDAALPLDGAAAPTARGAAGVAGAASAADARAQSVNLANYTSVFEQIQSRLAAGDVGGAGHGALAQGAAEGLTDKSSAKNLLASALADARADTTSSLGSNSAWSLPVTEAAAAQAATDGRDAQAGREKSAATEGLGSKAPAGGMGGGLEGVQFTPTVHFEAASASVDLQQPAPEAAVADQVSYWISQGVQNAELTFGGPDDQPVQVSISLSGNEAHVVFRSDEAATRDFLSSAEAHLRDLLQSEGMVLSGMSVGSSGADGSAARERRAATPERQSAQRAAVDDVPKVVVMPARSARGAIDLFV